MYAGLFDGTEHAELAVDPSRKVYVHVVRGTIDVNGMHTGAGDGVMLEQESRITLGNGRDAEVLVFDLAP